MEVVVVVIMIMGDSHGGSGGEAFIEERSLF